MIDAVQLCMGPGEETLVTGGYDQAVRVWDMRSRSFDAIQTMKLFADSVTTVAVSARCDAHSTQAQHLLRETHQASCNVGCTKTSRESWDSSKPAGGPEFGCEPVKLQMPGRRAALLPSLLRAD